MRGMAVIALVTFQEAARKKILLAAALLSAAYVGLFSWGLLRCPSCGVPPTSLLRREIDSGLLMVGLYGVAFFTALLAVLSSIDSLAGEIASGAIQTVAIRPLERWHLVLGKWLGYAAILALYVVLVGGSTVLAMRWTEGFTPPHLAAGLLLIWWEGLILLTVTLLFGTFCSTLTSGICAVGLYGLAFLGGWVEQIGAVTHRPAALRLGVFASLVMPSEALWRRAVFEMQSPLLGTIGFSPFNTSSAPSGLMLAYAGAYLCLALWIAMRHFSRRDL